MTDILQKELKSFFSTEIGYIIISVFLLLTALFLWIIPGQWNVFDSGYASMDGLFILAPWLYLFLCPAISMRFFSEEKYIGTIEILLTKPINKWAIVIGKAMAGWILVIIALLPSLFWYVSVFLMSEPVGNVDSGSFIGAWIGLLLLAMNYISIGTWCSSLSSNQVVAFLVSALVSFLMFYGFEFLGSFLTGQIAFELKNIGILEHYKSISRGVVDSRDIIYFLLISVVFLFLSVKQIKKK